MKRQHWIGIGAVAGLGLAVIPLLTFGSAWATLLGRTVQNFGHIPLFGFITTLFLVLATQWPGAKLRPPAQYAVVLVVAITVSVLTELAQMIGPRDADLQDLARNCVGVVLALGWWGTFDRRLDGRAIRRSGNRFKLRIVSVAVVLSFLTPLVGVAKAYRERTERFPVLFTFETPSQARFLVTRLAAFEFVPPPEGWVTDPPKRVARIRFNRTAGGSLILSEPHPDWSGHTTVSFELFNPGARKIEIGLAIDDQSRVFHYRERYNTRAFLDPGLNRLRVPMQDIVAGPADRDLDISSIDRIILFTVGPVEDAGIYLGPIRLEAGVTVTSSTSPG